jgi:hypothetical protein
MTLAPTTMAGSTRRLWAGLAAAALGWATLYLVNEHVWDIAVFDVAGLDPQTRLGHAVHFRRALPAGTDPVKRVMRLPLLAIFTAVVTVGIVAIGFIFDLIV